MNCTEYFQRKKYKWLKTHKEMLNIPDHKGTGPAQELCVGGVNTNGRGVEERG
jgi:hypothetical protein